MKQIQEILPALIVALGIFVACMIYVAPIIDAVKVQQGISGDIMTEVIRQNGEIELLKLRFDQ